MSLLVVGLSHRSAPVDVLERVAVSCADAGAEQAGTVGRTLHEVVQHALRVGKRVHTETGIDAAGASVVSEALAATAAALTGPDPGGPGWSAGAGARPAGRCRHHRAGPQRVQD